MRLRLLGIVFGAGLAALAAGHVASAQTSKPITLGKSPIAEEEFQTQIVAAALEKLGYKIGKTENIEYATAHIAVANGDIDIFTSHWNPLQNKFYESAGGDAKLFRKGVLIANCLQGYLIDKKTAEKHNITNYGQLKDPKIARIFDTDGDGKADLTGCNSGWGCERVIEHHLDAYGLRDTVEHNQGKYSVLISDTIARYRTGKPILYYTWTPYWTSGVLAPNKDVVWLQVPHTALPKERGNEDTALPNGKNYGFAANNQHVIANRKFIGKNPKIAKLLEVISVSANDISAQNQLVKDGQKTIPDARRHARQWIKSNQSRFDGWIKMANAAN